jgi:RimJ/RimL family protein N-acetyltransferase
VVLNQDDSLVGLVGFVPSLTPFGQLLSFARKTDPWEAQLFSPEVGLYYAVAPSFQRQGYASEAAHRLVQYAFDEMMLKRVVATTTYDNAASIRVMNKLGMRVERNPFPDPPWFQIVGVIENRRK